jgi:hypothetical protein
MSADASSATVADASATQQPILRSTGTLSPSNPKPKSGGLMTGTATHARAAPAAAVASP